MKNIKKTLLVIVAMILMCAMSAAATLALFNSQTETVENTFVFGKVEITLDELDSDNDTYHDDNKEYENPADPTTPIIRDTKNLYDIDPRGTYFKDPTIHNVGSEDAYLRVVITLNKANVDAIFNKNGTFVDKKLTDLVNIDETKWTLAGTMNTNTEYVFVYDYTGANTEYAFAVVAPGDDVVVFTEFTVPEKWEGDGIVLPADGTGVDFIKVEAYALQASLVDAKTEACKFMDAQWECFAALSHDHSTVQP